MGILAQLIDSMYCCRAVLPSGGLQNFSHIGITGRHDGERRRSSRSLAANMAAAHEMTPHEQEEQEKKHKIRKISLLLYTSVFFHVHGYLGEIDLDADPSLTRGKKTWIEPMFQRQTEYLVKSMDSKLWTLRSKLADQIRLSSQRSGAGGSQGS